MTCAELDSLLHPYLDGEFEPHEQLNFEQHLAGCAECARRVHSEMAFRGLLRRTSQVAAAIRAPDSLRQSVEAGFHQEDRRAKLSSWFKLSAAAMVVLSAGAAYYFYRPAPGVALVEDAALALAQACA